MDPQPPISGSPMERPECVSGSIGDGYLELVTAALKVESAALAADEFLERYDIHMDTCILLEDGQEARQELRESHAKKMKGLNDARLALDSTAKVAGAAKECAATAAGASKDTPWGAAVGGVAAGIACGAGAIEAGAEIASLAVSNQIDKAQIDHDNEVAKLEEGTEVKLCYNEAKQHMVGSKRAALDSQQAEFDLRSAQGNLSFLIASAQRVWAIGHGRLQELDDTQVRPPGGDSWVDEDIQQFQRYQRLAQRATYLAVRAVEYEQQATLPLREAVLDAATPTELDAVLQELWASAATRTVGGSRPSDLHAVLSLKSDVLRLQDEPEIEGVGALSATERFRLALSSQRYAVYDGEGKWMGQRVPFELVPQGAFGFDVGAVPIYAQTDCAERIWSVNASIVGEGVMNGSDQSNIRLDLLKRNTFFSQWCGEAPEGQPYQFASTRPARNLFRAPGVGGEVGGSLGFNQAPTTETRARIQAYLGVERKELEGDSYASGATSELAARGLFGQYALFLPADFIATESADGQYSTGLVLDRIDDVLLRLDYVSAAR